MRTASTWFAAIVLVSFAPPVHAVDVTTCGQVVARRDAGVLQADLDCSGTGLPAIALEKGAALDLNGHTIVGGPLLPTIDAAGGTDDPPTPGDFTVRGPGVVAGTAVDASPFRSWNACINVRDGRAVITSATGVVEIYGCEVGVSGGMKGPDAGGKGRVTMDHVTVHDNFQSGTEVRNLVASDVEAHHHARYIGLAVSNVAKVRHVLVHHNNVGLAAKNLAGEDLTASDNEAPTTGAGGQGVIAERANLVRFTAHGNTNPGIGGARVRLVDSTLTGNGLRPPHVDVDIQTDIRPRLKNTVCLHSEVAISDRPLPPTYPDWGVCTDD